MPVGVDRRGRVTLSAPRWVKSPTRVGAFTQTAAGPEAGAGRLLPIINVSAETRPSAKAPGDQSSAFRSLPIIDVSAGTPPAAKAPSDQSSAFRSLPIMNVSAGTPPAGEGARRAVLGLQITSDNRRFRGNADLPGECVGQAVHTTGAPRGVDCCSRLFF